MSEASFSFQPGARAVELRGELSFSTAARAYAEVSSALAGDAPVEDGIRTLDLQGLQRIDSAGMACLLAWRAQGDRSGQPVRIRNMPEGLQALARVCEVQGMLGD